MPRLGINMNEGKITAWLLHEGSPVNVGDPLFEMITDKTAVEVEAESRGILLKIIAAAGSTVPISATVAVIGSEDEDISDLLSRIKTRKVRMEPLPVFQEEELHEEDDLDADDPGPATLELQRMMHMPPVKKGGGFRMSPRARRRATQAGIDPSRLRPSRGAIITMEDVETYILSSGRPKKIVIIGAGQYSAVIREILGLEERMEIAGYVDTNKDLWGKKIDDLEVLGGDDVLPHLPARGITCFIVSVGSPQLRACLFQKALDAGLEPVSAIHRLSCISEKAWVEPGSVVEAFSYIAVNSRVERGAFITQNCSVSHDCVVGEFSHLAPGTHLGGGVAVGRNVILGVGVSVSPWLNIGDGAVVTPGSSVDAPVPPSAVVKGCPARPIGRHLKSAQKAPELYCGGR
jgi:UDP-perosamine 4-acetyltransferase